MGQSLLRWLEMASTVFQRIRPRVRRVTVRKGGGGGTCKFNEYLLEIMHVDQGAWGRG